MNLFQLLLIYTRLLLAYNILKYNSIDLILFHIIEYNSK